MVLEILLGQLMMEWAADWQPQQPCGNRQVLEVHPEVRLNWKQTGPFWGCCLGGSTLGQSIWLW